jgi:hypothetical protein
MSRKLVWSRKRNLMDKITNPRPRPVTAAHPNETRPAQPTSTVETIP